MSQFKSCLSTLFYFILVITIPSSNTIIKINTHFLKYSFLYEDKLYILYIETKKNIIKINVNTISNITFEKNKLIRLNLTIKKMII